MPLIRHGSRPPVSINPQHFPLHWATRWHERERPILREREMRDSELPETSHFSIERHRKPSNLELPEIEWSSFQFSLARVNDMTGRREPCERGTFDYDTMLARLKVENGDARRLRGTGPDSEKRALRARQKLRPAVGELFLKARATRKDDPYRLPTVPSGSGESLRRDFLEASSEKRFAHVGALGKADVVR